MFKIFSYILKLYRQNVLLKRAINEIHLMVLRNDHRLNLEYQIDDCNINSVFMKISALIKEANENKQQPTDTTQQTSNNSY